jgi:hypothetical protein
MLRRPSPAFVLAFVALLVSLSGVSIAAIPAKDGDIHACYSKKTFEIELVDTQKDKFACEKNWQGLTIDTEPTSLVSPNGQFRVEVTNDGARIAGPEGEVAIGANGVAVKSDNAVDVNATNLVKVRTRRIDAESFLDTKIVGKDINITGSGNVQVRASGTLTLKGSKIDQN